MKNPLCLFKVSRTSQVSSKISSASRWRTTILIRCLTKSKQTWRLLHRTWLTTPFTSLSRISSWTNSIGLSKMNNRFNSISNNSMRSIRKRDNPVRTQYLSCQPFSKSSQTRVPLKRTIGSPSIIWRTTRRKSWVSSVRNKRRNWLLSMLTIRVTHSSSQGKVCCQVGRLIWISTSRMDRLWLQ